MKKSFLQISIASTITLLAVAAIVSASTTIGDNISTDGTLNVVGTTTFSGNVGIGTTTPLFPLHEARANAGGYVFVDSLTSGYDSGILIGQQGSLKWQVMNSDIFEDNFTIYDADSSGGIGHRLTIDQSGNVGIGTTTPNDSLEIYKDETHHLVISAGSGSPSASVGLKFQNGGGTYGASLQSYYGDLRFYVGNDGSGAGGNNMAMYLSNTGNFFIGDTANSKSSRGLTINQGEKDDEIISLKSNDISHNMSGITEIDTFGYATKYDSLGGGLNIFGLTDNYTDLIVPLQITGAFGTSSPSVSFPAIHFRGGKTNGSGSWQALSDTEMVFKLTNYNTGIMYAYGNGSITKPLQPSFLAYNSSTDSNVTGAGTFLYPEFDSEAFDQGDNYDTSTDTFTAPTTGKYAFTAKISLINVTAAMNDFLMQVVTSNRTFNKQQVNAVAGTHEMEMTIFTDMDAGDTAKVGIRLSNGAGDTASIYGAAAPAMYTVFSGYLVN